MERCHKEWRRRKRSQAQPGRGQSCSLVSQMTAAMETRRRPRRMTDRAWGREGWTKGEREKWRCKCKF